MRSILPGDVKVAPFYDQSLLVRESINSVRDSILIGLVLSIAILFGFLRNWGATFVASLVIPVTLLARLWRCGLPG
jgi:multidrug efflux pump subunit AcrB